MRKRNFKGRILSRPKNQRVALLKSMAGSLFMYGKITTTHAKAKELKMTAERLITVAKKGTLANKRLLAQQLDQKSLKKLFGEIAPSYLQRNGGYTRIIKLEPRKSDSAKMAIIELVK